MGGSREEVTQGQTPRHTHSQQWQTN